MNALLAGLAGAATVTLLNESVRQVSETAPRLDVLGRAALRRGIHAAGLRRPRPGRLQPMALAGDMVANTVYYSAVGCPALGGSAMMRGAMLGAIGGLGAIALPGAMGLPQWPTTRSGTTAAMTFGWYFAAGLAAGATMTLLEPMQERRPMRMTRPPQRRRFRWREPDPTAIASQEPVREIYATPT